MQRRAFLKVPILAAAARYAYAVRALPDLKITGVKAIPTSAGAGYRWVFLKVLTSEPGLYGIGSASNVCQTPPSWPRSNSSMRHSGSAKTRPASKTSGRAPTSRLTGATARFRTTC